MISKLCKSLLPDSIYQNIKHVYKENITEYKRDIYSEFGEDFIAAVLLAFKKNGFYVDIGAFRPKELSTTYYFYKKLNWSGLVIEPNPKPKSEFESQRPRDTFVNHGVAKDEGNLDYHKFVDGTLNSFDPTTKDQFNDQYIGHEKIKVRPLSSIFDDHLQENQSIDLMNVDVEGLDLEVLHSNNWEKYSPQIIMVEDLTFQPEAPLESEIVQFLKSKGYKLKANCFISLIFYKE